MPDTAHVEMQRTAALRSPVQRGQLWALGSAVSYALSNVFIRVVVIGINPLAGVVFREVPTALYALTMSLSDPQRRSQLNPRSLGWPILRVLILYGACVFWIGNSFFFMALQQGGVVVTSPLIATSTLWSAILAAIFLRERLTWSMLLGIVGAVVGVILLTLGRGGVILGQGWLWAVPFASITAFSWAAASPLMRYALQHGVDRFVALLMGEISGLGMLLIWLVVTGQASDLLAPSLFAIAMLFVAGVFTAGGIVGITTALGLAPVATVTTIGALNPLLSVVLAAALLNEVLTPVMVVGIVLVIVGVVVVQRAQAQGS